MFAASPRIRIQKRLAIRRHRQWAVLFARRWRALELVQNGLPHAPISWVVVQKQFHDLVVATYGRGFYILDDITPLEQMAGQPASQADTCSFLLRARPYRFIQDGGAPLWTIR